MPSPREILEKYKTRKMSDDPLMKQLAVGMFPGLSAALEPLVEGYKNKLKRIIDDFFVSLGRAEKQILSNLDKKEKEAKKDLEEVRKEVKEDFDKKIAEAKDDLQGIMDKTVSNFKTVVLDMEDSLKKELSANKRDLEKQIKNISLTPGEQGEQGEKGEQGSPDTPEDVASKINTLDEKIEMSSIKGLEKILKVLQQNIRENKRLGGGGGGGMGNWVTETPTGSVNGSNTSFTLSSSVASNGQAIILLINGQTQEYTNHFTVSGNTITMVTAPETGDALFAMFVRK